MNSSFRKKFAKRVIWSMNMNPGDTLRISGGAHTQDLVEEMAVCAMEQGIDLSFSTVSDRYTKAFYERVGIRFLKKTSRIGMKMAEVIDNSISIERPKDPRIMENISPEKIAAAVESSRPISKMLDRRNIKWCALGYPTEELAAKLGIKYSLLKKFIFGGIMIKPKVYEKRGFLLINGLKNAKFAHITDEHGSDLRLRIVGRKIKLSDGYISDHDIKHGDVGLNLPDGEVFTTPLETYAEGVLVSPKRADKFTGKMIEDIGLVFEKGKLSLKKTTAEKNEKAMKTTIKKSMEIDRKNENVVRTTNPAELGIGINPVIDRVIGYLLTDEKIGGTVHVAIGMNHNKSYGGRNQSCLHWDFVTNRGVSLEIEYNNGKKKFLLQDGKFCFN
jgi:aminopeptidase